VIPEPVSIAFRSAAVVIAGNARKELERRLKRSIVSKRNYLTEQESPRKLRDGT